MSKSKLLTIRIDETTRQRFTAWAKTKGTTAAELVNGFVFRCLAGDIDTESILSSGEVEIEPKDIDSRIDERIEAKLANFKAELEELVAKK